ncbi:hypothetical protein, partial [Kriegella aquimaris]
MQKVGDIISLLGLELNGDALVAIPIGIISKYVVASPGAFYQPLKVLIMGKKKISLEVINPNAAGIDIGSKSHWAA